MESDSLISSLVVIVMYSRYITITINVQTDWKRFHAKQLHLKSIYKLVKVGHMPTWHYKLGHFIILLWSGSGYAIETWNNIIDITQYITNFIS